jgi:hypothetical protein
MPRPLDRLRSYRPRHATLVAYLSLFVALGGTSIAAVSLKRNSVKGKHIAKNAVTSPKVKDASLGAGDLAPGVVPSDFYSRAESDARFASAGALRSEGWREVETAPQDNTPARDGQFICNSYSGGAGNCVIEWSSHDAPYGTAAYRKDAGGFVHLRGAVANSSLASTGLTTVFRLPPGYRAASTESRIALKKPSNSAAAEFGRAVVQPNGDVQVDGSQSPNGFYLLDGITFAAAP